MTVPEDGPGLGWVEYPGLAGFTVCPLTGDEDITIQIVDQPAPPIDAAAVETRWREMSAANPRLFDGPILSVLGFRHDGFVLRVIARRGSYKHLAVQNQVEASTDQLSVTAVVQGLDAAGQKHILLGRRGETTRIYGGMWELGPSGGIDPPAPGVSAINDAAFLSQVHAEVEEEMGGGLRVKPEAVVALTYDPIARSYDIVVYCTAVGLVTSAAAGADTWEYRGSRWLPESEIAAFDREHAERIIGTTRALFRCLGWVARGTPV